MNKGAEINKVRKNKVREMLRPATDIRESSKSNGRGLEMISWSGPSQKPMFGRNKNKLREI